MSTFQWIGAWNGDWENVANWVNLTGESGSYLPYHGDTVIFRNSSKPVNSNLDQSNLGTLNALIIESTYTGTIGTSAEYLQVHAQNCEIGGDHGFGGGVGSALLKLDFGDEQNNTIVYSTNSNISEDLLPPVRLLFDDPTSSLEVRSGIVGVAIDSGEISQLSNIVAGLLSDTSTTAVRVTIGKGCHFDYYTQNSGTNKIFSDEIDGELTSYGGDLTVDTISALLDVTAYDGVIHVNRSGVITTILSQSDGRVDLSRMNTDNTTITTNTVGIGGTLDVSEFVLMQIVAGSRMRLTATDI